MTWIVETQITTIHNANRVEATAVKLPSVCHPSSMQLPLDKKGQRKVLVVRRCQPANTVQRSPTAHKRIQGSLRPLVLQDAPLS